MSHIQSLSPLIRWAKLWRVAWRSSFLSQLHAQISLPTVPRPLMASFGFHVVRKVGQGQGFLRGRPAELQPEPQLLGAQLPGCRLAARHAISKVPKVMGFLFLRGGSFEPRPKIGNASLSSLRSPS